MGPVAAPNKHGDFLALVRDLRALGATRVRAGDLEAAFAAPQMLELLPETKGRPGERLSLSTTELDELEDLRAMRRRAEELGVDL